MRVLSEDRTQQIESDRLVASRSTYWSCGCGFDHVDGCKTKVTMRIITIVTIGAVIGCLYWWFI